MRVDAGVLSWPAKTTMPRMKFRMLCLMFLLAAGAAGQQKDQAPPNNETGKAISADQVPGRRELMRNKRVIVAAIELEPGKSVPMHRHERDSVTVMLTDGELRETVADDSGAVKSGTKKVGRGFSRLGGALRVPGANSDKVEAGAVNFNPAGYTHAHENKGKGTMRAVTIEFLEPAGKREDPSRKQNKYCNQDNRQVCVEERYLFCTDKFCVEEVTMDPTAVTSRHSHVADHMLVAITDYRLSDDIAGKGKKLRVKKAGEVEYVPSGIAHQLTNAGPNRARFVVIAFR